MEPISCRSELFVSDLKIEDDVNDCPLQGSYNEVISPTTWREVLRSEKIHRYLDFKVVNTHPHLTICNALFRVDARGLPLPTQRPF
jgi:hypothetical protein